MGHSVDVEVLNDLEVLIAAAPAWNKLFEDSGQCEPFLQHSWVVAWFHHLAEGGKPNVFVVRHGRQWLGVLPLVLRKGRWHRIAQRTLAFPVGMSSANLRGGLLALPGQVDAVVQAISGELEHSNRHWERLQLDGAECGCPSFVALETELRALASRGFRQGPWRLWIDLHWVNKLHPEEAWGDYLKRRGKHFRLRVRAAQRQFFERIPPLRLIHCDNPDDWKRSFEWLLEIDCASSKSTKQGVYLIENNVKKFLHEMLAAAAIRNQTRFDFVLNGDQPVAALLTLVTTGVPLALYIAHRPEYGHVGPGRVLIAERMQLEWPRARAFDFNGRTKFVERWADSSRGLVAGSFYSRSWRGMMAAWLDTRWRDACDARTRYGNLCTLSPLPHFRQSPLHETAGTLPASLQSGTVVWFSSGRMALAAALTALPLLSGDEILFPAYHCGSEFDELCRAGMRMVFYDLDDALRAHVDALEAALTKATRAVYIIHYMGRAQEMVALAAFCRERGLLLIEDCAQALYASDSGVPVGILGDCAIFSLHKFLPLIDGGALRWNRSEPAPMSDSVDAERESELYRQAHLRLVEARPGSAFRRQAAKELVREFLGIVKRKLLASIPENMRLTSLPASGVAAKRCFAILPISEKTMRHIDHGEVVRRRCSNYRRLHQLVADRHGIQTFFPELASGFVPLVFGLHAANPEPLLSEFRREGIEAGLHWNGVDGRFPYALHSQVVRLKAHLIVIPVHQEMTEMHFLGVERALERASPRLMSTGWSLPKVDVDA